MTNNETLKEMYSAIEEKPALFWPGKGLSLDNAAMIAGLGFHKFKKSFKSDELSILPQPICSF